MTYSKIMLYSITTCVYCQSIKRILETFGLPYESADVDLLSGEARRALLVDLRQVNGRCTFPTLTVDDKVIVGYKLPEIMDALGLCTEGDRPRPMRQEAEHE
ncbi:MAG: glutaredoxin family protein [Desulfobulbaceae bacterium]|nr:MAG: glutaredoxin family protein [Desulfobulbaceae bacterium]